MNKYELKHIEALKKRANWLSQRMNDGDKSYDKQEYSALNWAINIINEYFRKEI